MTDAKFNLNKFNMQWVEDNATIMMLGKRNTGKSYLLKDLLYYHQDIPSCVVVCPTESSNKFYSNFVPDLFIFEDYEEEIVRYFNMRQRFVKSEFLKEIKEFGTSTIDGRSILILDDCLYDDKWIRSSNIRWMFMNGRHSDGMFIMTSQAPMGIPPSLRNNLDYVFILRNNIDTERQKIYKNYASVIPDYNMFCKILNSCTEDYKCLVVHVSSKSNDLRECVYWYRATEHEEFSLGSKDYWNYHKDYYNENYEKEALNDMQDQASNSKSSSNYSLDNYLPRSRSSVNFKINCLDPSDENN